MSAHINLLNTYAHAAQEALDDNHLDALMKLRALTRMLQTPREDCAPSVETLQNYASIMESLVDNLLDWHGKTEVGSDTSMPPANSYIDCWLQKKSLF